ncbi:MAG: GMC family oxidoreductase [Clostridia bacterium]|nr:GMC family oxidoreductase [Deltaproteobacteria bacterium]
MSESFDAVVVGSGAGGGPVAYALATAGARVLVLERGKHLKRGDFVYDEVGVAKRSVFVPSVRTDPHVVVSEGKEAKRTDDGWIAVCVGGGTVHMSGFFYRLRPEDFHLRDFMGPVAGASLANWPITYEQLEPYYARVESLIGVSGNNDEGPHVSKRSTPYPLPAVTTHPGAALIDRGAVKVGAHAFTTARGLISRDYDGRAACHLHPLCGSFGCHVGAKSSSLETWIPKAVATGKCEVRAEARVTQIVTGDDGTARSVVYRDSAGAEHAVDARVVVVACSAVETSRLLLASTGKGHAHGIGNANGQIGAGLMFSSLSKAHGSFAYAKSPEMQEPGSAFLGRSVGDYYFGGGPLKKAGGLNFIFPAGGPVVQSELAATANGSRKPLWGKALKDELHAYWHDQREVICETFGEYFATPGTRVTLDPAVKDSIGLPVATINIERHPHDVPVSNYLGLQGMAILEAAGATRVWTSNVGGITWHLPLGGCRMGSDASVSAVNADCRVHGVKNVYVSDGSVFSSSGGWPPTLTIMANALRVGEGIAEAMKRREL